MKQCIQSLLSQSVTDFNIIILDNNSTDGTSEWIKSLNNDKIVIYRSSQDLTIEENWARILPIPKNEFVTIIGHDDILFPNYLKTIDELISKFPDASLYLTHFDYIDASSKQIRECKPMSEKTTPSHFLKMQMTDQYDSTGSGYMMRCKDFNSLGGMPVKYPNLIFADFQLWISLMLPSFLAVSSQKCFSFRIHNSTSRRTNGMDFQQAFSLYIDFLISIAHQHYEIKKVITSYGREFLLYYCEALSHRLLKTPIEQRSILVSQFVQKCRTMASRFIPGQTFKPEKKMGIWLAEVLDQTNISRNLFQFFRKKG